MFINIVIYCHFTTRNYRFCFCQWLLSIFPFPNNPSSSTCFRNDSKHIRKHFKRYATTTKCIIQPHSTKNRSSKNHPQLKHDSTYVLPSDPTVPHPPDQWSWPNLQQSHCSSQLPQLVKNMETPFSDIEHQLSFLLSLSPHLKSSKHCSSHRRDITTGRRLHTWIHLISVHHKNSRTQVSSVFFTSVECFRNIF